ncbi:MAG: ferric reductase-like transmembrane domain-containing protein [Pseudomonadota bacterium]
MATVRAIMVWGVLAALILVPIVVAADSEYLQYRSSIYVAAGFAGIAALALLLVQPLLASGALPLVARAHSKRAHRWLGVAVLLAVALHVAGLWITSPPDMVDALTFTAPTAFSVFGVLAMWALIVAALLGGFRKRLRLRPAAWRLAHTLAVTVVVTGSVAHALLIEGTMGVASKVVLSTAVLGGLVLAVTRLRPWVGIRRVRKTHVRE